MGLTVSAFWADRPATRDEAAVVLAAALERIGSVDPVLAMWRDRGWTKRAATESAVLGLVPELIAPRLKQNRADVGRQVIAELGYSLGAWNGAKVYDDQASFSAHIGVHAKTPGIRNNLVIDLPRSWCEGDPRVSLIVDAFVASAQPDEVVLFAGDRTSVLWNGER